MDEKYYLSDKVVEGLMLHKKRQVESGRGFGINPLGGGDKMNALAVGGKGMYDLVKDENT